MPTTTDTTEPTAAFGGIDPQIVALCNAITVHVPFDGWSDAAFDMACGDVGITVASGRALVPSGGRALAEINHRLGDLKMVAAAGMPDVAASLAAMRYRDRIAALVRIRIEAAGDVDVVRRAASLFALPLYAPLGAQLIWGTADRIWTTLGDTSRDVNWYSKRATLSAVYSSVVLFWMGDTSEGHADTWAFLGRRIDDVMSFEKTKAKLRENKAFSTLFAPLGAVLARVQAPATAQRDDFPGRWAPKKD